MCVPWYHINSISPCYTYSICCLRMRSPCNHFIRKESCDSVRASNSFVVSLCVSLRRVSTGNLALCEKNSMRVIESKVQKADTSHNHKNRMPDKSLLLWQEVVVLNCFIEFYTIHNVVYRQWGKWILAFWKISIMVSIFNCWLDIFIKVAFCQVYVWWPLLPILLPLWLYHCLCLCATRSCSMSLNCKDKCYKNNIIFTVTHSLPYYAYIHCIPVRGSTYIFSAGKMIFEWTEFFWNLLHS